MHDIIYQISSQPISKEEHTGIDHIETGNMISLDYAYESNEKEHKENIRCLVGHILPKEMFSLNEGGGTIIYRSGFAEWRKSYLDTIHARMANINEENIMKWVGPAYQLQKAILNPLCIDAPFVTDFSSGHGLTERSRELMAIMGNLEIGDKLYVGAAFGYHF